MAGDFFNVTTIPEAYEEYLVPTIFRPWADLLVQAAGVGPGDAVLDVASGTGVVARAARSRVGPGGVVVATDVSPVMLAHGGQVEGITTVACPATALEVPDGRFDVVLCQQGLQFMDDRAGAGAEMGRALRGGGMAAVAVWLCGPPLVPFDLYGRALEEEGVEEPFPGAYAYDFCLAPDDVGDVLAAAGLEGVAVAVHTLDIAWPSVDDAVRGITGTPYGPTLADLEPGRQDRVAQRLREWLPRRHPMAAVVGTGRREGYGSPGGYGAVRRGRRP